MRKEMPLAELEKLRDAFLTRRLRAAFSKSCHAATEASTSFGELRKALAHVSLIGL